MFSFLLLTPAPLTCPSLSAPRQKLLASLPNSVALFRLSTIIVQYAKAKDVLSLRPEWKEGLTSPGALCSILRRSEHLLTRFIYLHLEQHCSTPIYSVINPSEKSFMQRYPHYHQWLATGLQWLAEVEDKFVEGVDIEGFEG